MTYYFICCLFAVPLFPILIIPYFFRYHTMRYKFDAEGVSMRWGILFRREVLLNYSRIQDIHLQSNLLERWLGLGRVLIQTASGNAMAEMTIEGLLEFEAVRDFLYARMRGAKEKGAGAHAASAATAEGGTILDSQTAAELITTLRAVGNEVRALREAIEHKRSGVP
jgi:putative membrane protein